jgi:hypothetical protein
MKFLYPIFFFVSMFLIACSGSTEGSTSPTETAKVTNPNGMSEMSLIMEDWYNAMKNISDKLNSGNKVKSIPDAEAKDIYKAKTSKPNIHGKEFDAFVQSYFYNYSQIEKAGSVEEQKTEFNLAVKSCLNCHEQFCHGPMVRIKKLTVNIE